MPREKKPANPDTSWEESVNVPGDEPPSELPPLDLSMVEAIDPNNPDPKPEPPADPPAEPTPAPEPPPAEEPAASEAQPAIPNKQVPLPSFRSSTSAAGSPTSTAGTLSGQGTAETIVIGTPSERGQARQDEAASPPPSPSPAATQALAESGGSTDIGIALKLIDRLLTQQGTPNQLPQQMSPVITPEQGALAVLTLVKEEYCFTLREIATRGAQGSLAAVIAGLISHLGDQGQLSDFSLNPEWLRTVKEPIQTLQTFGTQASFINTQPYVPVCEFCKHTFKPSGFVQRQRFCCNACGNKFAGYTDELLPHRPDCTTAPGIELKRALDASKPKEQELQ